MSESARTDTRDAGRNAYLERYVVDLPVFAALGGWACCPERHRQRTMVQVSWMNAAVESGGQCDAGAGGSEQSGGDGGIQPRIPSLYTYFATPCTYVADKNGKNSFRMKYVRSHFARFMGA